MRAYIKSQFGNPRGSLGYVVGWLMRYKNAERLDWVVSQMYLPSNAHILEIGCGPGVVAEKLLPRLSTGHMTAVDQSPLMLKMTAQANRAAVVSGKLRLVQGVFPSVALPASSFDVVFGVNVSLFWPDPVAAWRYIRTLLAPDGVCHLFFHPHWLKDPAAVRALGERMEAEAEAAGFRETGLRFHPIKGVEVIYVCAGD